MSKIVHLYDEVTGEYSGRYEAQESPLELGSFITPIHSTETEPPTFTDNQLCKFINGNWIVEDKVTPLPPDPPSLAELKALKNSEINAARLSANQTTFSYQGKQVSCDTLSRSDIDGINGYVATRGEMPGSWIGGWKATDNSIILIPDVQTWNAFYDSMIAQGQANFAKSESLKAQLAAATTPEQVAAITW